MSPLLMVRSFVAFALSRWEFVFSGVLAPPDWHHDLQVYAHKAYRAAFALPPWTCNAFLHLPLHAGGVGCPSLPLRNLSLLAMTYLHASVSRNPLSRASAVYLLDTMAPFSEGMALRTALATLRTRVHTHPFPHLHDMRVHAHVASDDPLPDVLWVVTDGALAGHRVGGGIVFYSSARSPPVVQFWRISGRCHVRRCGMAGQASRPIPSQGLGRPSQLPCGCHRIHALRIHQAPPPRASILNHLFRQLVSATVGAQEFWMRAQHDTGHTHTVALL